MKNYQKLIGDGKLPNKYWVFHFDEIATRENDCIEFPDNEAEGGLLGEFKTFEEAINCIDNEAFYPHTFIEDRLSGMIFEQYQIKCKCCGSIEYETINDTKFTRDKLGDLFK